MRIPQRIRPALFFFQNCRSMKFQPGVLQRIPLVVTQEIPPKILSEIPTEMF